MTAKEALTKKLTAALDPRILEVLDETSNHGVPPGSESHFRLRIVAEVFEGASRVARHRMVNDLLADELGASIHALALELLTPNEWSGRGGATNESPPCLGGDR